MPLPPHNNDFSIHFSITSLLNNFVTVPFGSGYIQSSDGVKIGFEMCEELWTARSYLLKFDCEYDSVYHYILDHTLN